LSYHKPINFSCPFAITSFTRCEIMILYKSMAKSMRNGKFRPPTASKLLEWILMKFETQNYLMKTTPPTTQKNFISIRRCGRLANRPTIVCHCHWKDNYRGSHFSR